MAAADPPVVICVYRDREHAEQLAVLLRDHGLAVAVAPSDCHVGEWEVLVPARDAGRATRMVQNLLAPD
jgi:hypothetical protein